MASSFPNLRHQQHLTLCHVKQTNKWLTSLLITCNDVMEDVQTYPVCIQKGGTMLNRLNYSVSSSSICLKDAHRFPAATWHICRTIPSIWVATVLGGISPGSRVATLITLNDATLCDKALPASAHAASKLGIRLVPKRIYKSRHCHRRVAASTIQLAVALLKAVQRR